tara:strand:- start:209 stop:580 length:372 start_codon:yes stop_codon:yes gene_type:complete
MRRQRKGAAAIEFAFVAPVMIAIFLAMVEYGLYFTEKQELYNIVTESCGEDYSAVMDDLMLNYFESCIACDADLVEEEEHYICDLTKQHYQITGFFPAAMVPQKFELRAVSKKTEEEINDTGG